MIALNAYPDDYILLLLDNAAWRHSSAMAVADRVELFPLLPYTPELNLIEVIWDEVREKGFSMRFLRTWKRGLTTCVVL